MNTLLRTMTVVGATSLSLALLPLPGVNAAPSSDAAGQVLSGPALPDGKGKIKFCTKKSGAYNYEADGEELVEGRVGRDDCDSHAVLPGAYEVVLTEIADRKPLCGGGSTAVYKLFIDAPNGDRRFTTVPTSENEREFKTRIVEGRTTKILLRFRCI
ncbi:MAG: hypothetical protein ACT4PP_07510 [Sporichthyaceae bacterium]